MSSLVGGIGIIGQDMVCGFGKKTIVFINWESGDWTISTGEAKDDKARIRTPWKDKKRVKSNTKYKITLPAALTVGVRLYEKNGNYIQASLFDIDVTNYIFTTKKNTYYLMLMLITTQKDIKVIMEEVS